MLIVNELLKPQAVIKQCIEQLERCEMSHVLLCSNLKDVLFEHVVSILNNIFSMTTTQIQLVIE